MGVLKVNTIQLENGNAPTLTDLGFSQANTIVAAYHAVSSSSAQTLNTTSYSNITDLSVTMTPKFTNSKILIMATIAAEVYGTHTDKGLRFRLYGGASGTTTLYDSEYDLYNSSDSSQRIYKAPLAYVDSASSDARTYNIGFSATRTDAQASARVNNYGEPSVMTVLEIGQ